MKLEFFWQMFKKISKYQIPWKSVQWEQSSVWMDGHGDTNSHFTQLANVAKSVC